jgi:hypothetical protein
VLNNLLNPVDSWCSNLVLIGAGPGAELVLNQVLSLVCALVVSGRISKCFPGTFQFFVDPSAGRTLSAGEFIS